MEGTMKRLALHDRKAWVEQAPIPSAHGANVVVRLESTPICGSDKKHFLNPDKTIRYAGHEGTGVVVEVDKSNLVKVGDRVLTNCLSGCGVCEHCRSGNYVYCENKLPMDQMASHFCQYTILQDFLCIPLPEDISYDMGTLAGCVLAPAFQTLQKKQVIPSDLVMVLGCGPVGLGAITIAKHYGAQVLAVEISGYRKNLARKLGADFVVDGGGDDLEQRILELTHGRRPNKVVDTSGFGPLQQFGMKMAAVRGHFGFVGHNPKEITIIPNEIIFKGLTIYGSWHVNLNDIPTKLYDIIRRSPVAAKIITHTYSLDQAQDAFDTFIAGNSGKILFHPWE